MRPTPSSISRRLGLGILIGLSLCITTADAQPYTAVYTYDAQGRLTHAGLSTTYSISYTYDAAGNLLAAAPGSPVSIDQSESLDDLPTRFALHPGYPNPFNPTATFPYDVKESTHVRLEVFDLLGRRISTLVDAERAAGRYEVQFHAASLPSGVYIYRIEMAAFRAAGSVLLVK